MNRLLVRSKLFAKKNASTILTCIGGAGVVATAVMGVTATPKALKLIEEAKEEKGEELTKFEKVVVSGSAYIPTVLVGVGTIACIFGANALNKRQQAALTSAYAIVTTSFQKYRAKVTELLGEDGEQEIRTELAKDEYENVDISVEENKQLFYDGFSERYFESTLDNVRMAQYNLNRDLSMGDCATLNEWYTHLGIEPVERGEELGWSTAMNMDYYWQTWIDFTHHKMVMDDGLECIYITINTEPCTLWDEYM